VTRRIDDLLADLAEAADAAAEIVRLGKKRWDSERLLRLAGEAIISRLVRDDIPQLDTAIKRWRPIED
jgi:hypothetical protein